MAKIEIKNFTEEYLKKFGKLPTLKRILNGQTGMDHILKNIKVMKALKTLKNQKTILF